MMNPNDVNDDFSELLLKVGLTLPTCSQVRAQISKTQARNWLSNDYECRSINLVDSSTIQATVNYTLSGDSKHPYDPTSDVLRVQTVMLFKRRNGRWTLANSEILKVVSLTPLSEYH